MLSATQGKYELDKSSGRIVENINYVYYFTYFHEYSEHPYWKEFKTKIKGCVPQLTTIIERLKSSHDSLINTVTNARDSTSLLLASIDSIDDTVNSSIKQLTKHVTKEVVLNKVKIRETIKEIETKINKINESLKILVDLKKCKIQNLQFNINFSILTIQNKISAISLNIIEIKFLLSLSSKITYTLKVGKQLSLQGTNSGDSYAVYYQIESSESTQEVGELEKIEQSLKSIAESIPKLQPLQTPLSLPTLDNLKANDLAKIEAFQEKINQIDKHLDCLEGTIIKFQQLKGQLEKQIKKLPNEDTTKSVKFTTFNNEQSTVGLGTGSTVSQNSKGYYIYIEKITKTIVTCKDEIQKLLPQVGKEIDELQKEYEKFKKELTGITQQLEDLKTMKELSVCLKYIKFLKCILKNSIFKSGKIEEKIEELIRETSEQSVKIIFKNECRSPFLAYVELMKLFVRRTLCLTDKVYPKGTNLFKQYLNTTRRSLYDVDCELTKLLRLGDSINNLSPVTLGIKHLKEFQEKIKVLEKHKNKLNPFIGTLNGYVKVLDKIGTDIKEINDLKDKLPDLLKLQDMPENLQTINEAYTSIEKLNLGIEDLRSKEFMKSLLEVVGPVGAGGAGGGLSSVLDKIKETLSEAVNTNFKEITQRFRQKVVKILTECSTRLSEVEVPKTYQNSISGNISICRVHANILIPIVNSLNNINHYDLIPDLRDNLKKLETGIPALESLCKPDEVCGCISEAVDKIKLSCDTDKIVEAFGKCIKELEKKKDEIEQKRKEISEANDYITVKLKDTKALLVRLCRFRGRAKFSVECLEEIFTKVTNELVVLLDKVGNVICRLGKEIEYLKSQLDTTKKEITIFSDFRDGVEEAIKSMEKNIKEITEAGTNIAEHYSKYTSAFREFNQKLKELETCLDHLIKGFLSCSL